MDNKKILVSFLLVVLIALSVSAVSAEDAGDVIAADDVDADVIAVDDVDADVIANTITPVDQTVDAVQNAVNNASAGDTIKLNGAYDFAGSGVTIQNKDNLVIDGQGTTTITGYGDGQGLFYVTKSAAVTITGITFIDNNPANNLTYGGNVAGWGVQFNGNDAKCGVVDNCKFQDFNQAVVVKSCNNITVKNSEFKGGIATKLVNDPTVNKEQGSKVISVGGSFFTTIQNNTFEGVVLDALSIAQGSGDARIIGNTFIDNVYAIFFGGASTEGTFITGNTFINCGSYNGPFNGTTVLWEEYPVISIQKAASGVYINNNTFKAINKNFLIAAEQGNAAHGYPSTLGDINVTNNIVELADSSVNPNGITLLHILCRAGDLNPFAPITVTGNKIPAGVKTLVVWENDWGKEDAAISNIVIPAAALVQTQIEISNVAQDGTVTAVLKDINGKALSGQAVSYTVGGNTTNTTTDVNGAIAIAGKANDAITIEFNPADTYAAASAAITLPAENVVINNTVYVPLNLSATTITVNSIDVKAQPGKTATITAVLKDADGNVLANKTVSIIDPATGKELATGLTDENGAISAKYSIAAATSFNPVASFNGDGTATGAVAYGTFKVVKNAVTLTKPTKTYKVKATKKITLTLKSGGKALAKKKVTLKVNGKTYTKTTTSAGKVTFTVKITKKGTYKTTAKFAGDAAYKAITKTGKIVVKK